MIADDSVLLREGLARLLAEAGLEVCALTGDADSLVEAVDAEKPDVAVIDIRMPPTYTHEGARAATDLRVRHPDLGILLLSQSLESRYAAGLARQSPRGFGYLLKDRVVDVSTLTDAVTRVAGGGTVLDPDVVAYLLGRRSTRDNLAILSDRERQVLALMAQGRSNTAICRHLTLTPKTIESHISSILTKLDLPPQPEDHRRVLAVLAFLNP
ncbi:response regulator transcription factor [Kribbella sp. CA-247076]|uniref:response regulator transcription factor n=1 Tax=Kribbella sp. CA-247076 TaxID=3239941 RepID=UPI003D90A266